MSSEYKNNHYVPQWYQKRFLPQGQDNQELYYLDLKPGFFTDPRGVAHPNKALRKLGFKHCFAENDLYTARFGDMESRDIERVFFGKVDSDGKPAVDYFTDFQHTRIDYDALHNMLLYMSTQKLRTPKGLDWLSNQVQSTSQLETLRHMTSLRNLYSAIWMECIWQIADASQSNTKFIVSDHPVTVYNRRCGPRNQHWCRGSNDPDIRLHGTHTVFPLTLEKVLILTNLSWVRNPYQSAVELRPNPSYFRGAVFNYTNVQTLRHLSEQEVREINFIIKSRAYRYIGAGKEEWLYPELYVSKSRWNVFGDGYLLMPDPRPVNSGGEYYFGYNDGTSAAFDVYGRRPWEADFGQESGASQSHDPLYRFKGEFARRYGPYRRGRSFEVGNLDNEKDSNDFHQYHLSLDKKRH